MALDTETVVASAPPATEERHSYIDWAAVIGGIVLASAISLLLLTFGSAIGLSLVDFRAGPDVAPIWIAIAGASWLLWVQISSFMAGGYVAGRMRRRAYDATEHESDIRDGVHGLLVWGGALVIGAIIAVGGLGSLAGAAGAAIGTATTAAATALDEADVGAADAYFSDMLFRAGPGATPAPAELRSEAGRIIAQGAVSGEVAAADRTYLAELVAANTGLGEAEAAARVDETLAAVATARAEAAEAAEQARRWSVLAAFLTAASLLVSAVGAYWAAMKGGDHRDKHTIFAGFGRF